MREVNSAKVLKNFPSLSWKASPITSMIFTKMLETVLLYTNTRYVDVTLKAFQGKGFGGDGRQYMGNLFKANKVKLISFFLCWCVIGKLFKFQGGWGWLSYNLHIDLFFFKIFFKSWGACPPDPPWSYLWHQQEHLNL